MAIISNADLNAILDECVRFYMRVRGISGGQVYGIGEAGDVWGAVQAIANMDTYIAETMIDTEAIAVVIQAVRDLGASVGAKRYSAGKLATLLRRIERHVVAKGVHSSVVDLDSYLTYRNTMEATKWQTLQAPDWRELYNGWRSGRYPQVWNVYFEVLQGTTYPNALRKLVIGSGQTAGFAVDTGKYCGGFPKLRYSGVSTSLGSLTMTVTGTAYDPATRSTVAGKTWQATASPGSGVLTLSPGGSAPAPANSLIVACSDITAGSGVIAGTFYAEAHRPAGRPLLP